MRMKFSLLLIGILLAMFASPAAAQYETLTYATAQRYEHGLMIWRSDNGDIWALVEDGSAYGFPSFTYATLPDNPIFGTPPSRLRPIMGMGKVWGHNPHIRTVLGWPTLDELGFNMPVRVCGSITAFTQLDGTVIEINTNGSWQRIQGDRPAPSIMDFHAMPQIADAGDPVTLYWQVQGTTGVQIEMYAANGSRIQEQIVDNLPLVGSLTFTIPYPYTEGVRFVLWGVDRAEPGIPGGAWVRRVSAELVVSSQVVNPP